MNSLRANSNAIVLPPDLIKLLAEKINSHWTGSIALNFKEGAIIAFEITEKRRIVRETHVSPS